MARQQHHIKTTPQPQPKPNYNRPPSWRDLERWNRTPPKQGSPWKVDSPKIETRDPAKIEPWIPLRALARIPLLSIFVPTPTADATFDDGPFYWQSEGFTDLKDMAVNKDIDPIPSYDIPPVTKSEIQRIPSYELTPVPHSEWRPQIKGTVTKSPKKGTVQISVPDVYLPPPFIGEIAPDLDIWNIPEHETEVRELLDPLPESDIDIDLDPVPQPKTRTKPQLREPTLNVKVEIINTGPTEEPVVVIKLQPTVVRSSRKRRKDTKANRRWIKAAHKFINVTYGTYSEMRDLMEVLAWNAYLEVNGKRIPAMVIEKGRLLNVMKGIGEGKYELDIGKAVIDFAMMQTADYLQGKFSQRIVDQSVDQGWWQSPQGPTGFVNNMNSTLKQIGF